MAQIPQFVQPNIGGAIRRSGQIAAGVISSIPGLKQQADDRKKREDLFAAAAKEASADWKKVTTSYGAIKQTFDTKLDSLVESKQITAEDKQGYMAQINKWMPLNSHKKDMLGYFDGFNKAVNDINEDIKTKSSQQRVGGAVQKELLGTPAQPQPPIPQQVGPEQQITTPSGAQFAEAPITAREQPQPDLPAVPPAQSQLEAARGITRSELPPEEQQQAFQDPRIKTLPTDVQLQKQKKVDTLDDLKAENLRATIALKVAKKNKIPAEEKRAEKRVQISEDALKRGYNRDIGRDNTEIFRIDKDIKVLKQKIEAEEDQDPDLGPGPDAGIITGFESQITELNAQREDLLDDIQDKKNEKKLVGAVPGETRTFKSEGTPAVQSPGATQKRQPLDVFRK